MLLNILYHDGDNTAYVAAMFPTSYRAARRYAPAYRGGSTSVRGRIRSPHSYSGLAKALRALLAQVDRQTDRQTERQTDLAPAASYWFRRVLDDGGRRDYIDGFVEKVCRGRSLQCAIAIA